MPDAQVTEGLIRPARPDEHRLLSRIAIASKCYWPYPAECITQWSAELTLSRASLEAEPTFVLENGGAVVAFYQLETEEQRLALGHFWLLPDCMGQGFGRRLLSHAREQALAMGHNELMIDADPFAEGFYQACGAKRIGTMPAPIPGEPGRQRPLMSLQCSAVGAVT